MKNLLIGVLVLLTTCGCSILYREHTVKVPDTTLTRNQAASLNNLFDSIRGDFDFTDKKVAFLEGRTKMHISEFMEKPYEPNDLYILTDSEKVVTNGYDAIIVRSHLFVYNRNKYIKKVAKHPLSIKVIP